MVTETLTLAKETQQPSHANLRRADNKPSEWHISEGQTPYLQALHTMQQRAAAIAEGQADELIWLVEHPPLYTAGTSAKQRDLLEPDKFPVYDAGRGGQYTYHGPGQRVAYAMLDLRQRRRDIRCLVSGLEQWVIDTLAAHNIRGERREGRVGVWVPRPKRGMGSEDKIAAIGVRVSRWVSFHGISLNIAPDLSHYTGIIPCGISDNGVTSFEDLGQIISMAEVDSTLKTSFEAIFGPVVVI